MRTVLFIASAAAVIALASPAAQAASPAGPEIVRDTATAQPVGQVHTLRNIPEACVRLEGRFVADGKVPYEMRAVKRDPCVQRAGYMGAAALKKPPSVATGWILNDRIRVPRSDKASCVATVEVWRREGNAAPPELDPQGRARMYLDTKIGAATPPLYSAVLVKPSGC